MVIYAHRYRHRHGHGYVHRYELPDRDAIGHLRIRMLFGLLTDTGSYHLVKRRGTLPILPR